MALSRKVLGKLTVAMTIDEMLSIAARHNGLVDGKVDLRGARVRFDHDGLDLSRFLFGASDLSGSKLTNCQAPGVSFADCQLRRVRITAEQGSCVSFSGCSFDGAVFENAYLGPKTLDLSASTFRAATIVDTTFMVGHLGRADFSRASLRNVMLRSADLQGAVFRNAQLERVCFEKAALNGADFSDAVFVEMEQWGEPNFSGALISDDLRYQYGIVADPVEKINRIVTSEEFSGAEVAEIRRFQEYIFDFATSAPEVMLIGHEYEGVISMKLFCRLMKSMKQFSVAAEGAIRS